MKREVRHDHGLRGREEHQGYRAGTRIDVGVRGGGLSTFDAFLDR